MEVEPGTGRRRPLLLWGVVALSVVLVSSLLILGADLMWVVSVGDVIRETGRLPDEVPNLVAPQVDWQNPVAFAQVLLSGVHALGWAGLPALALVLTVLVLVVVVVDGRAAGGTDGRLAVAVGLLVVGASSSFVIVRFPMLSLLPFVVLVALLRARDRGRDRLIWWVPPLMVLWGNLHGAVLVGLAVLGVFVLLGGRRGLGGRVVAGALSLLALLLTSAGWGTPQYYVTALGNEAAVRGSDLWARPDLTKPLDLVMLVAAAAVLLMARRSLRLWEWFVVAGLVVGTISAARNGVWLLLFLAPVAGVPQGRRATRPGPRWAPSPRGVAAGVALALGLSAAVGLQLVRREDAVRPPGEGLVGEVARLSAGGTVLALEPEAETFAQRGIRVWVANPIDAFDSTTQGQFLDFLHDCSVPSGDFEVVVVDESCMDTVVSQGWSVESTLGTRTLLVR